MPATAGHSAALITGVVQLMQLMQRVLEKRPESVTVIIDEVDPESWGVKAVSRSP